MLQLLLLIGELLLALHLTNPQPNTPRWPTMLLRALSLALKILLMLECYTFCLLDAVHTAGAIEGAVALYAEHYQPETAAPGEQSVAAAGYTDAPLTNMRKVTAARLSESKATIPHYYLQQSIAMDNVNKLRKSLNTIANGAYRISVNDFMIMVATPALRDVPEVNRLMPEESQGCSFTISNMGMYGISSLSAIINPLHAAILSVGVTEQKLVLDESSEKGFKTADVMSVQLSADHRVVDGATGALFLKAFKGYLENPLTLIL